MSNKNKSVVCIYTEGATDKVFYDRLLDFIGKYTMDRFALSSDGKSRISPRNIMAREMAATRGIFPT